MLKAIKIAKNRTVPLTRRAAGMLSRRARMDGVLVFGPTSTKAR